MKSDELKLKESEMMILCCRWRTLFPFRTPTLSPSAFVCVWGFFFMGALPIQSNRSIVLHH